MGILYLIIGSDCLRSLSLLTCSVSWIQEVRLEGCSRFRIVRLGMKDFGFIFEPEGPQVKLLIHKRGFRLQCGRTNPFVRQFD